MEKAARNRRRNREGGRNRKEKEKMEKGKSQNNGLKELVERCLKIKSYTQGDQ